MTKSLVKIAKELNVGTTTIVDFLNHSGFEIENKPNAKITDDMYTRLLKEFQRSIDDKEASKHISIGVRSKSNEPEPSPLRDRPETEVVEKAQEEERPRVQLKRPTVLGKIDLTSRLHDRTKDKSESAKPQEVHPTPPPIIEESPKPATVEAPVEPPVEVSAPIAQEPIPALETPPPAPPQIVLEEQATPTPPPSEVTPATPDVVVTEGGMFRADTPELRGLKILGKIDEQNKGKYSLSPQ